MSQVHKKVEQKIMIKEVDKVVKPVTTKKQLKQINSLMSCLMKPDNRDDERIIKEE